MIHRYKNNGYNIVLDVNSGSVHVVDDVTYDALPLFEEKKRIEEAEKKAKSKSTSKYVPKYKEDKSDPYNAKDYRNEEDFYYDHYDDFFDYYDAEQYYRDHHE